MYTLYCPLPGAVRGLSLQPLFFAALLLKFSAEAGSIVWWWWLCSPHHPTSRAAHTKQCLPCCLCWAAPRQVRSCWLQAQCPGERSARGGWHLPSSRRRFLWAISFCSLVTPRPAPCSSVSYWRLLPGSVGKTLGWRLLGLNQTPGQGGGGGGGGRASGADGASSRRGTVTAGCGACWKHSHNQLGNSCADFNPTGLKCLQKSHKALWYLPPMQ